MTDYEKVKELVEDRRFKKASEELRPSDGEYVSMKRMGVVAELEQLHETMLGVENHADRLHRELVSKMQRGCFIGESGDG